MAHFLHDVLPNEPWDPHFLGQELRTTYFDTEDFVLRKTRQQGGNYLTLRLRCYKPLQTQVEVYALSAKTESEKWREEIKPEDAGAILVDPDALLPFLPPNILRATRG